MKGESLKKQEDFLKQLGENLKRIRLEKNLTQEAVAFNAEISVIQVQRIEYGAINPTISTLKVIAESLDVPLSQLVSVK